MTWIDYCFCFFIFIHMMVEVPFSSLCFNLIQKNTSYFDSFILKITNIKNNGIKLIMCFKAGSGTNRKSGKFVKSLMSGCDF